MDDMPRYSIITGKNPREICLLRGRGCQWRRCAFCDYHLDFSRNQEENFDLNRQVLAQVDGYLGRLEIINSGSFCDLCQQTHQEIRRICSEKKIREANRDVLLAKYKQKRLDIKTTKEQIREKLDICQNGYTNPWKEWQPEEFCEKNIIIFGQLEKK